MDYELWEHPDWARQDGLQENDDDDNDEGTSLNYLDMDVINDWVVKLTFEKVINNKTECLTGSGFFLNLPNIINQHVILTAAHNLISNGMRTLNLKVIYNNPFQIDPNNPDKVIFTDDKKPAIIEIPVDNTDQSDNVHISRDYYLGLRWHYAVICIPRTTSEGPRGFGFSLKLAHRKSFNGNVHVSGFKGTTMKTLRPFTCSTSNMTYQEQCIMYKAKTEVGMSGSPVWVEYKGYPTVVAVQ
jgi:V8-like Glu-specific endopeptidase